MKTMMWKKGNPSRSGYYMVWNPTEEVFPFVMHCEVDGDFVWWTYGVHKVVLQEVVGQLMFEVSECVERDIRNMAKTKAEKEFVEKIINIFACKDGEGVIERGARALEENEYNWSEFESRHHIYDTGKPHLWSHLPTIFDLDNDEFEEIHSDSPSLNADIADVSAMASNMAAEAIEKAIRAAIQNIQPFDNAAPWGRGASNGTA